MKLQLNRPLVFIDLETTGINVVADRIIEISLIKLFADGHKEIYTQKINPSIPIPAEATKVHGITDDDVKDCPLFSQVGKQVAVFIVNCDLAGYNSNKFDIPLLAEEFLRVGMEFDLKKHKLVDVQNIFHKMEQRTLVAAYKFYCDKPLEKAHSAEADAMATYEVLMAQIDKYPDLLPEVDYLQTFSNTSNSVDLVGRIVYNEKKQEVFNFGKHKGKLVSEVLKSEPSYYNWIMNSEFPLFTKKVLTEIKLRDFGSK